MGTVRSVAVLGAGIMGCSTALYLARRGHRVVVFDQADAPFSGASRWNEGKIHLGYLYSASRSFDTARRVLPGGLAFKGLVEELIGRGIGPVTSDEDDIYLVHRNSVVAPDVSHAYYESIAAMVREHPESRNYLADASGSAVVRLTAAQLEAIADPNAIVAAYRVLERSVSTTWIADAFTDAVHAEAQISLILRQRVTDVRSAAGGGGGPWRVSTETDEHGPFDWVVNALWHGRPAIDNRVADCADRLQHHRYRVALFVRTAEEVDVASALIAVGPFGDMKNYDGRNFYLSWYPVGMLVEGEGIDHPPEPRLTEEQKATIADEVFDALGAVLPGVSRIRRAAADVAVQGGWVYAQAHGSLGDPTSSLHTRDQLGVKWFGTYVSVDTGKYSVAPFLAKAIAGRIDSAR